MTADFSGKAMPLPPGVDQPPMFRNDIPQPAWLSPVASHRLRGVGRTEGHLVVGGRTVWVESSPTPAAIVASYPNRVGSDEDFSGLIEVAQRLGATALIEVDPLLSGMVELPGQAEPIVDWPAGGSRIVSSAAACARQGADALRRRLTQIRGLLFPVEHPVGRTITVILPVPSHRVTEVLAANGTKVDVIDFWEGGLSMTVGWWHTRRQIESLAAAIGSIVAGNAFSPVPPDRFDRIPDDLPLRRLDNIS